MKELLEMLEVNKEQTQEYIKKYLLNNFESRHINVGYCLKITKGKIYYNTSQGKIGNVNFRIVRKKTEVYIVIKNLFIGQMDVTVLRERKQDKLAIVTNIVSISGSSWREELRGYFAPFSLEMPISDLGMPKEIVQNMMACKAKITDLTKYSLPAYALPYVSKYKITDLFKLVNIAIQQACEANVPNFEQDFFNALITTPQK